MASQKKIIESINLLSSYEGNNPYIRMLKRDTCIKNIGKVLNDFEVEYIVNNINFQPKNINKTIKIADWYGLKKKEEFKFDFTPTMMKITWLLGETRTTYHCYGKFRQSQEPVMLFIPKKAALNNFLIDDYNLLDINFDVYDEISTIKDEYRKLREHQKSAVKFLSARKKCILADGCGLGKTTALAVAALENKFEATLIICPASIKSTWKRELMWYVDEKDITIIESYNDKTKAQLEDFLGYKIGDSKKKVNELVTEAKEIGKWKNNKFVIVNYDILNEFYQIPKSNSNNDKIIAFENSPMLQYISNKKSLIIIDEAHKLSNTKSIRYKIIKDLINKGKPHSIYESTGTPITNKPINFYNVLNLLGDSLTNDWQYYVERYCDGRQIPVKGEKEKWTNIFCGERNKKAYMLTDSECKELKQYIYDNARKIWLTSGDSNLDELKERCSHIYLRRVKEDIPGMVNKTIKERWYDLTPSQIYEYNKLWEEYVEAQEFEDENKELNKELLEGGIYRRYISNVMVPHTIQLTEELIEDGEKVIISCCYDEELYTLQEYFKDRCVIYNGKMSAKQKDKAEYDFMNNQKKQVFIGNINSAGVGLTLTRAKYCVFNNFSFVTGDNEQFMDRIHRLSQTQDVEIIFQIFNNTQYEHMWNIVLKKAYIINQVIKKEDDK